LSVPILGNDFWVFLDHFIENAEINAISKDKVKIGTGIVYSGKHTKSIIWIERTGKRIDRSPLGGAPVIQP